MSLAQTLQRLSPPPLVRRREFNLPGEPAAWNNEEGAGESSGDGRDGERDFDEEGLGGPVVVVIGVEPRGSSPREKAGLMETLS